MIVETVGLRAFTASRKTNRRFIQARGKSEKLWLGGMTIAVKQSDSFAIINKYVYTAHFNMGEVRR